MTLCDATDCDNDAINTYTITIDGTTFTIHTCSADCTDDVNEGMGL